MHAQGPEEFETYILLSLRTKKLVNTIDNFNFSYPRATVALRKVYTAVLKTESS